MIRKGLKIGTVILVFAIAILGILWFLSPYRIHGENNYPSVQAKVIIKSQVDSVFNYLGNSAHASDWSVYVDHISSLNSDEVADGEVGSIRRCFKEEDESGIYWDEEIIEVVPNLKRRLTVFNLNGFAIKVDGLETEQTYRKVSTVSSELKFTLFFAGHSPSFMEELKMKLSAYIIERIFENNIENVRNIMERKSKTRLVKEE